MQAISNTSVALLLGVDMATLLGVGLLLWRGGRWTGIVDTQIRALCSRVRRLEEDFDGQETGRKQR